MKLNYYHDTDSLYIDLSEQPSAESVEVSEGVVLDYDVNGNLVGIDIDNASTKVQLKQLIVNKLPVKVQTIPGRVEMWRGSVSPDSTVAAPFVWRCLNCLNMTPFPHPAHRTGRADFPHLALRQVIMPSSTVGYGCASVGG
jgi:Uncharacterized conserved small protein